MYWQQEGINMYQKNDKKDLTTLAYIALVNDYFKFGEPFFEKIGELAQDEVISKNEILNLIQKRAEKSGWQAEIPEYRKKLKMLEMMQDVETISIFDEEYPEKLKSEKNPSLILYRRGNLKNFDNCIGIVGSRKISHYGHEKTRDIAYDFAVKGFTIASGLARGTDTEAHLGALEAGGKTIAVMASPITKIYPKENEILAEDIMQNGALISEKSGVKDVAREHFVYRNRITSGISNFVIISQSDGTGGTKRQFEIAKEQNKDIFILRPDCSYAKKGFKIFKRLGAIPIETADDILEYYKNFENSKKRDLTYWGGEDE
jgi:DNA processing protein